jgi:hypothetical protein
VQQQVSLAEMQRFVAEVAGTIHRNSNQTVTVGAAAMKWNSTAAPGAQGNWWSDAQLTKYDPQGYLDYYQIHYYDWMNGDSNWTYSPLKVSWQAGGFDKPVVIGEHPANGAGSGMSTSQMLSTFLGNCYAGTWGWSYAGVDGNGSWADLGGPLGQLNAANPALVKLPPIGGAPAPTATPAAPTATAAAPTATRAPATATPVAPTATRAPATATPAAPTATRAPATTMPVAPTATRAPATATPAPAATGGLTIYGDSLATGWMNWSWSSTVNLNYTNRFKAGAASAAIQYNGAWAGFYLHTDRAVSTAGYSKLSFWVHGGSTGGQPIKLYVRDGSGKTSGEVLLPRPVANTWTLVQVPLSQLGSPATLGEVFLQEAAGAPRPVYFLDDLRLVP